MSWFLIHCMHVFECDAVVRPLCPMANLFVGVFVWALAPFCVSGLLFLLTKRKSGWGICGSSGWSVWWVVCCDLPAFPGLFGPCTNGVFTAYAHVRTEPQCDIGHTRGKKCCPSLPKHHVVWNCLGVVVAGFRSMAWVRCWFCGDIAGRMLFSAFALQWIVLSRLGVALLSFVLVFWCVVCFWTPPPFCPSRLLTHAKGHFVPWQGLGHRSGLKF